MPQGTLGIVAGRGGDTCGGFIIELDRQLNHTGSKGRGEVVGRVITGSAPTGNERR
jgi:hypothetical protein